MKQLLPLLCLPFILHAEQTGSDNDNPWKIRAGVAWRQLGGTKVDPGYSASGMTPDFFSPNPASGEASANDDRTYDDGFVNIGAATATSGLTTNFGYDNDSQVNTTSLSYSLASGSALDTPGKLNSDDDTEIAPYLELLYFINLKEGLNLGLSINFSYSRFDTSLQSELTQYDITTIDSYTHGGVTLPLAPYSGSFAGPGPLIENQPTARSENLTPINSQTYSFENEFDIYSLGLGGELNWMPAQNCSLNFGAGLVINYVDWSAKTQTPTVTSPINDSTSDTDFLLGLYLKAGAGYIITESLSIEIFARYDVNENLDENVGNASFKTDLSGWTVGAACTYQF